MDSIKAPISGIVASDEVIARALRDDALQEEKLATALLVSDELDPVRRLKLYVHLAFAVERDALIAGKGPAPAVPEEPEVAAGLADVTIKEAIRRALLLGGNVPAGSADLYQQVLSHAPGAKRVSVQSEIHAMASRGDLVRTQGPGRALLYHLKKRPKTTAK